MWGISFSACRASKSLSLRPGMSKRKVGESYREEHCRQREEHVQRPWESRGAAVYWASKEVRITGAGAQRAVRWGCGIRLRGLLGPNHVGLWMPWEGVGILSQSSWETIGKDKLRNDMIRWYVFFFQAWVVLFCFSYCKIFKKEFCLAELGNIHYDIIGCIHYAVYYIPMTYLFIWMVCF